MTDDEILQLASETSGAHYMDHSHALRFARAVIDKVGAPSPCPHIRSSGTGQWATNWCALAEQPADHREVMFQALEALTAWDATIRHQYTGSREAMGDMHDAMQDGVAAIAALRKALAAGALDRLAQADRELGLGERSDG